MSKYKTLFDNDEVRVEVDTEGNYRVSFFENNHFKDEYFYNKGKDLSERPSEAPESSESDDLKNLETYKGTLEKLLREPVVSPYKVYYNGVCIDSNIPNCCRNCPNHPSNGGDGVCTCTAPLFDSSNPWKITC